MEYKLMEMEEGIVATEECIICFDGSTEENKVEPIDNIYIMPDCYCTYGVHSKCINEWQHIQRQQHNQRQDNYNPRRFYCLKCNSPVILKGKWKPPPENNYRRNNLRVVCVIISCIFGLVLLMLFVGLIVQP